MLRSTFYRAGTTGAAVPEDWPALIADGGYAALIFDCDGTLVHSGDAHFASFVAAVTAQGYAMDRAWYDARSGLDRKSTLEAFADEIAGGFDVQQAMRDSIAAFIDGGADVAAIPETVALLRRYAPTTPIGVVTNAERRVVKASLRAIDLLSVVKQLVTISDGLPAKPAPDMFTRASQRLGVAADRCLVFEDSREGIRAGIAAGMDVIGVELA